jgi:hypothetical protein
MPESYRDSIPIEMVPPDPKDAAEPRLPDGRKPYDGQIIKYIQNWRYMLRNARLDKQNIWNECWQLYRGLEDWSSKEDWQSKIIVPKAFSSVKQATNVIQRLLTTTKNAWQHEAYNPNDLVEIQRAERMTALTKVFLERAKYTRWFGEGLECGFMIGVGVWKEWWGLVPRKRVRVENVPYQMPGQPPMAGGLGSIQPPNFADPRSVSQGISQADVAGGIPREAPPSIGSPLPVGQLPRQLQRQDASLYPTQLPNEALGVLGGPPQPGGAIPAQVYMKKQIVSEEVLEGQLFIRPVDPYNFYWLPGSRFNQWTGTLEEIEVPKWELMHMAEDGVFGDDGVEKVRQIKPMQLDEWTRQSMLRWSERTQTYNGPDVNTGVVKITEYYGPIIIEDQELTRFGHVIIANDNVILINNSNPMWTRKPPYVAFSPLILPFRVDGVGIIEMVREINKGLSRIANLSVDTLMFRLMPLFEVNMNAYENPEDFETGMSPGKMFRRNNAYMGQPGINPIEFQDISTGAVQVSAELDRAHQEGAFVSEIQQGIPRFRGVQSATEINQKAENQNSFFGAMATTIEQEALLPIVDLATDLILQFIDTANDPRVASILGVDAGVIAGMSKEELTELIVGNYEIKVTGITQQIQKAEILQNLVQLMNIIGQNPEAWLPYLNQDELLRRILESFRPALHDIEKIIADPATVAANKAAQEAATLTPEMLRMIPQLAEMAHNVQKQQNDTAQAAAQQNQQQQLAAAQHTHQVAQDHHQNAMDIIDRQHNQQNLDQQGQALQAVPQGQS